MKKQIALIVTVLAAACNAVEISSVVAKQRWPWNNLVDVDFNVTAPAGEQYRVQLEARCADGAKTFYASTYASDPVAAAGANHVVWDFGRDYPNVKADDMQVSVALIPYADAKAPVYLVIDLSAGANAEKYPVRYSMTAPAHVQGAADEPCQTTELWLKRIRRPTTPWMANSFTLSNNRAFYGTLSKDYYIGVFELTQKQYQLVTGNWPKSWFTNEAYRASRPLEGLRFDTVVGKMIDPQATPELITATSFLGKLRAKTGLPINIPSNFQLNYAQNAMTKNGEHYIYAVNGTIPSDRALVGRSSSNVETTSPGRDCDTKSGTAAVGSYLPNDFGLYDVVGNVQEYTAHYDYGGTGRNNAYRAYYQNLYGDETIGASTGNPVIDPPGVLQSESSNPQWGVVRQSRDGAWQTAKANFDLWNMNSTDSSYTDGDSHLNAVGFRLSMTVE